MAESPEALYQRIVAQVGAEGRLPMPPVDDWDAFPWEVVDGALVPKVVAEPLDEEPLRSGHRGNECDLCTEDRDPSRLWENWNFHVRRPEKPSGMPLVLWLNSNQHLDFPEMNDELAAEYGKLCVWLCRIMSNLPNVGRVHVCRWGDGAEHLHTWFIARPARLPGILGSMAVEWDEMLPPAPQDIWEGDLRAVAERMANHDGRALV